jgi:hypothetical protein
MIFGRQHNIVTEAIADAAGQHDFANPFVDSLDRRFRLEQAGNSGSRRLDTM